MRESFEDRNRKPLHTKVVTMKDFMKKRITRIILARKIERVFHPEMLSFKVEQ